MQLIRLVDKLELAVGDGALGTARRQLRELDATSAMDVLKLLDQTTKSCDAADPNLGEMKAAVRMMRDVVVMFVVNRCGAEAAGDRHMFLDTAGDIDGAHLDRDLKSKLLMAYHKLWRHRADIWVGDGAADDPGMGEPRRRRCCPRQAGGG